MRRGNAICLPAQNVQCKSDEPRTSIKLYSSVGLCLLQFNYHRYQDYDRYQGNSHKVTWSHLRHICLQRPCGNNFNMLCKYHLTTLFKVAVIRNLKKPNSRRSSSYVTNLDIPKAYSGTLAATSMLKRELLQLCNSNAIPTQFHSFYESLSTATVMGDDPDLAILVIVIETMKVNKH